MSIFGKRRPADPATWDELWSVLAPLGGRLTAESVDRWCELLSTSSPGPLEAAAEQLGHAYRMLGTEAHAREIGPGAFTAADHPFAASRFGRIVDAVVAAGPDAVRRVEQDPTAIRSFAATVPLFDPASSDEIAVPGALGLELLRATQNARLATGGELRAPRFVAPPIVSVVMLDKDRLRRWPSLAGRRPDEAFYGIRDPEVPWLSIEAWEFAADCDDEAADASRAPHATSEDGTSGDWVDAAFRARKGLLAALGSDVLKDSNALVVVLELVLARSPSDEGVWHEADEVAHGVPSVNSAGLLFVPVQVSSSELSPSPAADEDARRADVLVRACARTLLTLPQVGHSGEQLRAEGARRGVRCDLRVTSITVRS